MADVLISRVIIARVCEQLSDDRILATGEVMAAAALVAVTAGLDDEQAVGALRTGLKAMRDADRAAPAMPCGKGMN